MGLAKLSIVPVRRGFWGNKLGKPRPAEQASSPPPSPRSCSRWPASRTAIPRPRDPPAHWEIRQGLRRHCQDLLLPDPGPVEGDPLPEVAIPGVLRLPAEEPSPCWYPEAGGQAVLRRTRGWRCKTDEILMWKIQQQLFIKK